VTQPEGELLHLSRAQIEALAIGMREIIDAVEDAFRQKGTGRAEVPPKSGIHPVDEAFIHAMPAHLRESGAAGMKWVSAYPGNRRNGLPSVSALIVLNDPATGLPLAVMDGGWITAKRTAAASALSAKYLARPDCETLGVLGCGEQARAHVEALCAMFPLRRISACDRHPERAVDFAREIEERHGIGVATVDEPRAAVAGLDLVVTAGAIQKTPHGTIQAGWLSAGAFASAVDFDSYWSAQALAGLDRFCTDDTAQLERFRAEGWFRNVPPVHADLGQLVAGLKPGRETPEERTMACNLGLAIADVAVADLVRRRALERDAGTWLSP
jgi:ornithine cyclodeaminase/alanine dehydrogenase